MTDIIIDIQPSKEEMDNLIKVGSYTITEDTTGNRYVAKGFIASNTGQSDHPTFWDSLLFSASPFFTNDSQKLASLFPLFLLVLVIIFALIDFGVIGLFLEV